MFSPVPEKWTEQLIRTGIRLDSTSPQRLCTTMTKEPHFIILERFTAKTPAEYRLKKSISNLNSPFVEHVDAARKFLKKAGKKALPYLQEAMEEKWFEENTLMYEVPLVYADIGVRQYRSW